MYTALSQLSEPQYQQVLALAQRCKAQDGGVPILYPHLLQQYRNQDNTWLYQEAGQCFGFLSVYFFYDNACEITVMIDPKHRQQGHAHQLLSRISLRLQQRGIQTLIFTIGTQSPHAPWLKNKGLSYRASEYHMQREGYDPKLVGARKLHIRAAQPEDIDALCNIDAQCFSARPEMAARLSVLIHDAQYFIAVAEFDNTIIGKAHIYWKGSAAMLSDIAILPNFQGQGLGSELLASLISKCLKEGYSRQILDVETQNAHALKLYQQYGFATFDAHDYWDIEFAQWPTWMRR